MRLIAEPVEIRSTFTGDLKAMSARLNTAEAEQAIVITVNHASAETLAALGESLEAAARFITNTTSKDHQLTVEQMVSLLSPQAPVGPVILVEAQMLAEAKKAVLESGDWLSERDIALLAESSCSASSRLNEWKRERRIFSIHHNGSDYFPIYALNKDAGYQPLSAMAEVLKVFDGVRRMTGAWHTGLYQ